MEQNADKLKLDRLVQDGIDTFGVDKDVVERAVKAIGPKHALPYLEDVVSARTPAKHEERSERRPLDYSMLGWAPDVCTHKQ